MRRCLIHTIADTALYLRTTFVLLLSFLHELFSANPSLKITLQCICAYLRLYKKYGDKEYITCSERFVKSLDNELKSQHIYSDALLQIMINGRPGILHVEFQTYDDPEMERRIMEYNMLASRQYDHLPVSSIVIYLRKQGKIAISPYIQRFSDGEETHRFRFKVIKLWELPTEMIFQMDLVGLLPLVTLTEDGKQPETVNAMIDRLSENKEMDLLAIASVVGGLVFNTKDEREWFRKRFYMFQDILRESWVYQEIGEDFLREGFEKGFEEKRQEERLRLRQMLTTIVGIHFPALTTLAKEQAEHIADSDALQQLTIQIVAAKGVDEVRSLLLQAAPGGEKTLI